MSIIGLLGIILVIFPVYAAIGPEPNPNAPTDYTPPRLINNVQLSSDGEKVIITWEDPPDNDFHRVEVLRNDGTGTPLTGIVRGQVQAGVQRYEDLDVISGQHYVYRFKLLDINFNTTVTDDYGITVETPAAPAEEAAEEVSPDPVPLPEGEEVSRVVVEDISLLPAGDGRSEGIASPADVNTLLTRFSLTRDEDAEVRYRTLLAYDMAEFEILSTAILETATVNFMVYGVSDATRSLGSGERHALVRDYYGTVGRSNIAWEDIERMASGKKPIGRNLENERAQLPEVLALWRPIAGQNPNFQNPSEDLAWNTLMYRVRFSRDLDKERNGISGFISRFKHQPRTPLEWAAVRALGYVLLQ